MALGRQSQTDNLRQSHRQSQTISDGLFFRWRRRTVEVRMTAACRIGRESLAAMCGRKLDGRMARRGDDRKVKSSRASNMPAPVVNLSWTVDRAKTLIVNTR